MRLIHFLLAFVICIAIAHALFTYLGWYGLLWSVDIPMHMAGGAFIALCFFYIFGERLRAVDVRTAHPLLLFCSAVGFAMTIGVLWEHYEYLTASLVQQQFAFTKDLPGLYFDTLKDLFDDLVGAVVASLIYMRIARRRR